MSELVEGARLEIVCTLIAYLEFESLSLRQKFYKACCYGKPFFVPFVQALKKLRKETELFYYFLLT